MTTGKTPSLGNAIFSNRQNNFDCLRLFMAVLVIFGHSFGLTPGGPEGQIIDPVMRFSKQVDCGAIAVMSFFIISGFLITQSWVNSKSVTDYLLRRVKRIFPGYTVTIFICALVVAPLVAENWRQTVTMGTMKKAVFSALSLNKYEAVREYVFPNLPCKGEINGSLWSVHYEFLCYLLVVVLGMMGVFKRRWAIAVIFFAAVSFHRIVDIWEIPLTMSRIPALVLGYPMAWPECFSCFMAGACFYVYREVIPHRTWIAIACGLGMFIGCYIPLSLGAMLEIGGAYLIFWVAFHPRIKLHHFSKYGDFSYGVYLYAYPIQQLLAYYLGTKLTPWTMMALAIPLSLVAGALSWHLVEKHFLPNRVKRMAALNDVVPVGK